MLMRFSRLLGGLPGGALWTFLGLATSLAMVDCAPSQPSELDEPTAVRRAALAGKDGPLTVSALGQFVNTYADLSVNAVRGATSITVSNAADLGVLSAGDLLLIIQMQGATIDTIDSNVYGNVTAINGAGLYEFVGYLSTSGNTLTLDATCGGLRNNYSVAGRTQILRVPQYTTLNVPSGTSISAPAWNGTTGGVVAIHAQGGVTLSGGNIDVSGKGFRGGTVHANSRAASNTLVGVFRSTDPLDGGEKGEGVAGFQTDLPNGRYGRGAPSNGGGGGNYLCSGGGGGANGDNAAAWTGQGVMDGAAFGTMAWSLDPAYQSNGNRLTTSSGGGRGGYSLAANDQDARTVGPGNNGWGSNLRQPVGGLGGYPVANNPASRLFLGGGGGAGDEVSSAATGGSVGGGGGGVVLLFARDISGNGMIAANGSVGGSSRAANDGAGGGGAGGTIIASASRMLAGVTVSANGAAGGNSSSGGNASQGPGGGGGGGYIATAGGTPLISASGGPAGVSSATAVAEFPFNGASGGAPGQANASANLMAGTYYPSCLATELVVNVNPGQSPIAPGGTALFAVTVENQGPNPLVDVRLVEVSPWTGQMASYTCTGQNGAVCPMASGKGGLAGLVDLPLGGMLTYVVTGPVPSTMTGGMLTYMLTASPPNGYGDPLTTNNSDSASVAVLSGNPLDLAIRVSTDPTEPALNEPLRYDFTVTNYGPGTTQLQTVRINLPTGASVGSLQLGDGWNCNTASQPITCTRNAPLAAQQTTVLQVVIVPPTDATSIRVTAQVTSSDGADLNAVDNNVRSDVVLGNSTVYAAGGGLGCAMMSRRGEAPLSLFGLALFAFGCGLAGWRRRQPGRRP